VRKSHLGKWVLGPALLVALGAGTSHASLVITTPSGSTTSGGSVSASAAFTFGSGTIDIVLKNLQVDVGKDAQTISGLFFTLDGLTVTTASLGSALGVTRHINSGGTFSDSAGAVSQTRWALAKKGGGTLEVGTVGSPGPSPATGSPSQLIIGDPRVSDGKYHVNPSVTNHNNQVFKELDLHLNVAGVTAASKLTGKVTFQFGTTEGSNQVKVNVPVTPVPEPSTILGACSAGLLGLALARRRLKANAA
jgi:hypothetical protein